MSAVKEFSDTNILIYADSSTENDHVCAVALFERVAKDTRITSGDEPHARRF